MRVARIGVALVAGLALPGCLVDDAVEAESVGEDSLEVIAPNGMSLNGVSLNGMSLNGMSLNGMSLNGMSLNGMSLNGMSLNGMSINGSQLGGFTSGGQPIAGAALVGTTLNGQLSSGSSLPLRIDGAETLPAPNSDVWAYEVSFQTAQGWSPLCGEIEGEPVLAVALTGTWNLGWGVQGGGSWSNTSSFTFGCRGTALAKCVELGYKPWQTVGGVSLRDHHQACTRLLRADYCGDGRSWTADGTEINLYDDLGIQADEASWAVDAEWTADGAVCVNHIRDLQPGFPGCVPQLEDDQCGSFEGGTVLINEYGGEGGDLGIIH